MNDAMTASELMFALAVIAVLLGLATMVLRTRALAREGNLAVMSVHRPETGWRTGMVRFRADRLEWFSFRTLRFSPQRTWPRGDFVLGSRNTMDADERPRSMTGDAVSVEVQCGAESFRIAMAPGDYTALRSWSESAPPGLHTADLY